MGHSMEQNMFHQQEDIYLCLQSSNTNVIRFYGKVLEWEN